MKRPATRPASDHAPSGKAVPSQATSGCSVPGEPTSATERQEIDPHSALLPWRLRAFTWLQFPGWFRASLLVIITLLAYQPVWHAGFIWDDDVYVTQNKLLDAPDGLWRIWFTQDSPSQYFPLVYTTFRLELALWGLHPAGYHWVNLLLHTLNALLVWRLLSRLRVPGAWLAGLLFALHPVQVESVAWVTECKNVMSLFFCLLALLAWVEFTAERPHGAAFYWLALLFYVLALFSKTTACTLPAALLLVLWLKGKPITRTRLLQVVPFVVIGVSMGMLTVWWERHHIGTRGGVFEVSLLDRLLIASRAAWFYAGKLLWPVGLTFSYPRWVINHANPLAYAWLAAGALLCGPVWFARRWLGRGPEVALGFFIATLSPLLGFVMLYTFRYTFVADHYQYAACIGPLALAAAAITVSISTLRRFNASTLQRSNDSTIQRFNGSTATMSQIVLCGTLVFALAALTFRHARAFRDVETLWRDTITKNPNSWLAHSNLGRHLMHTGRFEEAMEQYQATLQIDPRDVDSLVNVGNALFGRKRYDEALEYYSKALTINPDNPESHVNVAVILANRGKLEEAIEHDRRALAVNPKHLTARVNLAVMLVRTGHAEEALDHYRQALELRPDQPLTHVNLAIALNSLGRTNEAADHFRQAALAVNEHAHKLEQQGRLNEAIAQYTEAIRVIPKNAEAHCYLAALLVRQGRRAEAKAHLAEALRIRPDYAEAQQQLRALEGLK